MKKIFLFLALVVALSFTACGNKTTAEAPAADSIVDTTTVSKDVPSTDTVQAVATTVEEKQESLPEEKLLGTWGRPTCDADFMFNATYTVLSKGGKGTEVTMDCCYDEETSKTIIRDTQKRAITWRIDGKKVFVDGVEYKLKGNILYEIHDGEILDEACCILEKDFMPVEP